MTLETRRLRLSYREQSKARETDMIRNGSLGATLEQIGTDTWAIGTRSGTAHAKVSDDGAFRRLIEMPALTGPDAERVWKWTVEEMTRELGEEGLTVRFAASIEPSR